MRVCSARAGTRSSAPANSSQSGGSGAFTASGEVSGSFTLMQTSCSATSWTQNGTDSSGQNSWALAVTGGTGTIGGAGPTIDLSYNGGKEWVAGGGAGGSGSITKNGSSFSITATLVPRMGSPAAGQEQLHGTIPCINV